MEGFVNVRRKLFFYKRRQMLLLEDGSIFILKKGHINNEMKLTAKTEIKHQCDEAHCRFLLSTNSTYEYIECDSADLTQTWVNILITIRRMVAEGNIADRKSKRGRAAAASG
jgi:hypothetical protein